MNPWRLQVQGMVDTDWVQKVKDSFVCTEVADGIWVVPSWLPPTEPGDVNILLEPGLAFGTGPAPAMPCSWLCLPSAATRTHSTAEQAAAPRAEGRRGRFALDSTSLAEGLGYVLQGRAGFGVGAEPRVEGLDPCWDLV